MSLYLKDTNFPPFQIVVILINIYDVREIALSSLFMTTELLRMISLLCVSSPTFISCEVDGEIQLKASKNLIQLFQIISFINITTTAYKYINFHGINYLLSTLFATLVSLPLGIGTQYHSTYFAKH